MLNKIAHQSFFYTQVGMGETIYSTVANKCHGENKKFTTKTKTSPNHNLVPRTFPIHQIGKCPGNEVAPNHLTKIPYEGRTSWRKWEEKREMNPSDSGKRQKQIQIQILVIIS